MKSYSLERFSIDISSLVPGEGNGTPHSSTLAWKIPWTEEPGRLQSTGSWWVRHDWATSLSLFTFMHWRRTWQLTPVFLPGESQGRWSLEGCRLWGRTGSDNWSGLAAAAAETLSLVLVYLRVKPIIEFRSHSFSTWYSLHYTYWFYASI